MSASAATSIDLQRIFNSLPGLLLVVAPDSPRFTILAATDSCLSTMRRQRAEILGQPLAGMFPDNPDIPSSKTAQATRRSLDRAISLRVPNTIQLQRCDILRPEQEGGGLEERHWNATHSPVLDAGGEVAYVILQLEDITETVRSNNQRNEPPTLADSRSMESEKLQSANLALRESRRAALNLLEDAVAAREQTERANEALRESEESFRNMFELHYAAKLLIDPETESILDANQAAASFYGYTREQLCKLRIQDINQLTPAEAAAEVANAAAEQRNYFVFPHRLANGETRWVEVYSTPVETRGRLLQYAIIHDITARKQAEDALRRSEALYRGIGESIDFGIWVCAPDGRTTYVSESLLKLVGMSQEQFLNFGWVEALHPDDAKRTIAAWNECVRNGGNWDTEHRFRGVDGQWHPVLSRGVPVKDDQGNIQCWAGINLDIRLLRETENALRESEYRMRLATEATGVGIWEWHVPTGRIRWDAQMFRIYGMTPTKDGFVEYHNWSESVLPEDLAKQEERLKNTYYRQERDSREFRILRNNDGECRHIQSVDAVRPATQGSAEWVVGTNLDITERKTAEEALRRSEQTALSQWAEAEAILEAIPANIAILDENGTIIRVNRAWNSFAAQNGGTIPDVGVGTNYLEACDAAEGAEAAQASHFASGIRSVISGKSERFFMEYPCHAPNLKRWFIGYVTSARSAGPARAVVAHLDISAQKRIEEQVRILNQQLEFRVHERTSELGAAVIALKSEISRRQRLEREILDISEREQGRLGQDLHDGLGQELAGIAMLGEVLTNQLRAEVHPSAKAAEDIANYTRQSIQLARRLAKGLYPVDLSRYGLLFALEDLANQTSERFGIECTLEQSGNAPELGRSIEIHIYRIVQECISNAIRHGKATRISIKAASADHLLAFSVTDNGTGFELPVDNPGMGLHLMNYRARVIGGEIDVVKPAEGGCRVTCRLMV